jgi:hypothetical protein
MSFRAGELVEVRAKEEILATLDKNGRLEEMPFMPQMFQYCGKRFMVQKRAHKTCDPVFTVKARRVEKTVHLNLRCDGKAFGGCQAACMLFWKEAWLKPAGAETADTHSPIPARCRTTEEDVLDAGSFEGPDGVTRYVCQTTQLMHFTKHLPWWNPTQYVEDYLSGNVTLTKMLRGAVYVVFGRRGGARLPFLRRIHDALQSLIGGMPTPVRNGSIPIGGPVPIKPLDLLPGELVRVKSHEEILATINERNWHGGLYFDVEMVPFCGRTFAVGSRVDRFIDEKTGRMRRLKTPAVILKDVACGSHFSKCRMFCPRAIHPWWREEWLERVHEVRTQVPQPTATVKAPPRAVVTPEHVAAG